MYVYICRVLDKSRQGAVGAAGNSSALCASSSREPGLLFHVLPVLGGGSDRVCVCSSRAARGGEKATPVLFVSCCFSLHFGHFGHQTVALASMGVPPGTCQVPVRSFRVPRTRFTHLWGHPGLPFRLLLASKSAKLRHEVLKNWAPERVRKKDATAAAPKDAKVVFRL